MSIQRPLDREKCMMIRVESHCFDKNTHNYRVFMQMSEDAKFIYNAAQFRVRQRFLKYSKYTNYNEIDHYFKNAYANRESMLYRKLGVQIAQQIYRMLDDEWSSFFAAIKSYHLNPSKFTGRPKLPSYSTSDHKTFVISNQSFKVKDNTICFLKPNKSSAYWVHLKPDPIKIKSRFKKIKQLRIVPKGSHIKVEIVYEVDNVDLLEDNGRMMSIDPGMNNLLTCVSSVNGFRPVIYSGKPIKSVNQYYNKKLARLSSVAKKSNNRYTTKRIDKLTLKRTRKITQYMHEVSKSVIATALNHGITTIVIGNGSTNSKRSIELGKRTNQNFVSIPFSILINQLRYKSENVGIRFIEVEESYTSGTSFLDNETPTRENYDKTRRVSRGLFVSNDGTKINADVNGAYQIMKKVTSGSYKGVEGLVFNPVKKRIRIC